jgi:glucokinase
VRLDRNGTIVEQRCSGWAVDAKIRAAVQSNPASVLASKAAGLERAHAQALVPALQENCPIARRILGEMAADLAFGLSHVTHLMHPEIIVLGGGLSLVGEPLRGAVESALGRFVMDAFAPGPRVALAALREDAVPMGALFLAAAQADRE